jgi:hypothetical protein
MTFQPGHTLSPGRRPGSRNKRTAEIFNRLQNRGDLDPADLLSSIVTNNQEPKELRIQVDHSAHCQSKFFGLNFATGISLIVQ